MSHHQYTKDEKFVLAVYDLALESGDPTNDIDRYLAGSRAGLQDRGVNAICKLLIQANFIKKANEENIYLTPHGLKLVERLRLE